MAQESPAFPDVEAVHGGRSRRRTQGARPRSAGLRLADPANDTRDITHALAPKRPLSAEGVRTQGPLGPCR